MLKWLATATILIATVAICHASPANGDRAPDFKAVSVKGTPLSLADYSGKVVILDFFATWCSSCTEMTARLVDIEKRYKGKPLRIIGMNIEDSRAEKIYAYIKEKGINFPVVYAPDKIQSIYGVRSLPVVYVIGKDGTVAGKFQGYNEEIAASLESLLKKIQ